MVTFQVEKLVVVNATYILALLTSISRCIYVIKDVTTPSKSSM